MSPYHFDIWSGAYRAYMFIVFGSGLPSRLGFARVIDTDGVVRPRNFSLINLIFSIFV